eukprot:12922860-Prorocentrum_lima.AAC.1
MPVHWMLSWFQHRAFSQHALGGVSWAFQLVAVAYPCWCSPVPILLPVDGVAHEVVASLRA